MALLMGNLGVYKFIALLLGVSILSHIDIWFSTNSIFFWVKGFSSFKSIGVAFLGVIIFPLPGRDPGVSRNSRTSTGRDPNEQLRHLNLGTFFVFCFLDENSTQSY